jgi:uncharacterized protein (TIGR02186 family)
MAGSPQFSEKFRRRLADANRNVRAIKPQHVRAALTSRNAAFALGAAIVVVLIWIFNAGMGEQPKNPILRETGVSPPSAIVRDMETPSEPDAAPAADKEGSESADGERRHAALAKKPFHNPEYEESVEVDVSAKSVAITAGFSGQRIVVFGAVHKSLQASAEQGLYDVVVILEGMNTPLISRRKSNVAGLWINTQSVEFVSVPSYYTISSTRPIEEISTPRVFDEHEIGFRHVHIEPEPGEASKMSEHELQMFRQAVVRLKAEEGLYQKIETGVVFIGKSLFRTSIDLPANVPIGPVTARTYLFRDAELIAEKTATVQLERRGVEAFLYSFAFDHPALYGLFAVIMAVSAGLAASAIFNRSSS